MRTLKRDMKRKITESELIKIHNESFEHTKSALSYMEQFGIIPEGKIEMFRSPETRQKSIDTLPYESKYKQVVTYKTEPGEFSAVCPFSGLPDYGTITIEYIPGKLYLELKSLKYYLISFRNIGASQEDLTAIIFEDLRKILSCAEYLVISTTYNVRGGINTHCVIDSRNQ